MADSDVEICNMALTMIGSETITSLTDDSDEGRVCNLMYPRYRDAVLRSHYWNAALRRATLASVTGSPAFGFSNHHQLPADFVLLRAVSGDPPYRMEEARRIYSDQSEIKILYVYRVEDPSELGDLYADALATRLASVFAMRFRNVAGGGQLWRMYLEKLKFARFVESTENQQDLFDAQAFTEIGRVSMPVELGRTDI